MYIDCHAHLFFSPIPVNSIDSDIIGEIPVPNSDFIKKMILSAKERGVKYIVGVISNPDQFPFYKEQLKLMDVIHVIGISRNNAFKDQAAMISLLIKEIESKVPHGIGEMGLDYSNGFENANSTFIKKQQDLFRKQIQIAREHEIPIILHVGYGTDDDIVKILKEERAHDVDVQVHGYMSKIDLVTELLDMGFFFSFGYAHPRDEELRKIIEITPLEQILTETDAPYHIMEEPKKFILPEDIVSISEAIANLKEIDFKTFSDRVVRNARRLFCF